MKLLLEMLQPSQLYINQDKLRKLTNLIQERGWNALKPVPVKEINSELVLTDGHTRTFLHHIMGKELIEVEWEKEELDWNLYEICVSWCKDNDIYWIKELEDRIVSSSRYEEVWIERCQNLKKEINSID